MQILCMFEANSSVEAVRIQIEWPHHIKDDHPLNGQVGAAVMQNILIVYLRLPKQKPYYPYFFQSPAAQFFLGRKTIAIGHLDPRSLISWKDCPDFQLSFQGIGITQNFILLGIRLIHLKAFLFLTDDRELWTNKYMFTETLCVENKETFIFL